MMEHNYFNQNGPSSLAANYSRYKVKTRIEPDKDRMIAELTAHNKCLKQFTYITSHNLKVPLKNLKGLIGLLNYDLLDDCTKTIVNLLSDSLKHMDETVEDLSQMIKIHSNQNTAKEIVSITEIYQKACLNFTKQIHTMGIIIHTDFQVDRIPFIKSYLESIFNNLLSNAIKYASPERPLRLHLKSFDSSSHHVNISFEDNGLGIDLSIHQDKVFGLNQRFHSHVEGTGLGLYMTRTQVESMGGQIKIESTVNQGTTFYISVPVRYQK